MASKRQRGGVWEYTVKRAGVLEKPIYLTFATEVEGDAYCKKLEALLDRGIVPAEHRVQTRVVTISDLVREYERDAHPTPKDRQVLTTVINGWGTVPLLGINAKWVDGWVSDMKRLHNLAPATIRAKVGALARVTDWGMRKGLLVMPDHPLRTLPNGYSQYTAADAALVEAVKVDVERDRRLEPGEGEKVLALIEAGVLPRKQRPLRLEYTPALKCLFVLAIESAMRLREMYTLTLGQVDLPRRTVFLDRTKNGDKRQVPLSTVAVAALQEYLQVRQIPIDHPEDALFPWWDGRFEVRRLAALSDYLSGLCTGIFEAAGCSGLRFHDLRHEAISRLFERTKLSETEIMKISGHKSHRMMMRYANLRGSTLADALW